MAVTPGLTGITASPFVASTLTSLDIAVHSNEIYADALPILRLFPFSVIKTELNKQPGSKIVMQRFAPLGRGKKLVEGDPIVPTALTSTTQEITIDEYAKATKESELLIRTQPFDTMQIASDKLGESYALTLELQLELCVFTTPNSTFANRRASRAALVAGDIMTAKDVRDLALKAKLLKIPKMRQAINGGGVDEVYVMFAHSNVLRQLRDDTQWRDADNYSGVVQQFLGEVGKLEGIRFIDTTVMPQVLSEVNTTAMVIPADTVLIDNEDLGAVDPTERLIDATAAHPTLDVYKSIMFGSRYFGYAEGLPVELRDGGVIDFGREHALAWYSIYGCGLLNPNRGIIYE